MVNFFILAFVASAITLVIANGNTPSGKSVYESHQAPLSARAVKNQPSPVLEKRTFPLLPQILPIGGRRAPETVTARFSFKRVRVHGYLLATLNAILPHSTNVKQLCDGAEGQDPEKLSWEIVAELNSILQLLDGCLNQVKQCGTAPSPSGIPGSNPPTMDDICQLFFRIMCEIRECCKRIGSLCIKYKVVRRICQNTLKQITSCMASIAVKCGVEIGDMSAGLSRHFSTFPGFFADVQFGFGAFPSALSNGYGGFSINASL